MVDCFVVGDVDGAACAPADAGEFGDDVPEIVEGGLFDLLEWAGAPYGLFEKRFAFLAQSVYDLG